MVPSQYLIHACLFLPNKIIKVEEDFILTNHLPEGITV